MNDIPNTAAFREALRQSEKDKALASRKPTIPTFTLADLLDLFDEAGTKRLAPEDIYIKFSGDALAEDDLPDVVFSRSLVEGQPMNLLTIAPTRNLEAVEEIIDGIHDIEDQAIAADEAGELVAAMADTHVGILKKVIAEQDKALNEQRAEFEKTFVDLRSEQEEEVAALNAQIEALKKEARALKKNQKKTPGRKPAAKR